MSILIDLLVKVGFLVGLDLYIQERRVGSVWGSWVLRVIGAAMAIGCLDIIIKL